MTSTISPDDTKDVEAIGLISIEGDTVKLIYAVPGGVPFAVLRRRLSSKCLRCSNARRFRLRNSEHAHIDPRRLDAQGSCEWRQRPISMLELG